MNRFSTIALGFLLTFFSSWIGLVVLPIFPVGESKPILDPETGKEIPPSLTAIEQRGKEVYIANGCIYCHTQQVRPARAGTDIARGWGRRRKIAPDYANGGRSLLGTMRTGPDLSTIGVRNPSKDWHLIHLYNPQTTSKGSNMPPFPFLFSKQKIGEEKTPGALTLPEEFAPPEGYEIIPSEDALSLVAYLQALKIGSYPVPGSDRARIESLVETEEAKR